MATKNIVPRANNEGGIGTSAKRWANGYFTDINASGDLSVTGTITGDLTGNVTGNVTGDVTGDLTGNVTGNVTGDVTGDLTGNVTGNVTGDVTGDVTGNVTGDVTGNVTGDVTGNVTGNADTATSATKDGLGNNIATTYLPAVVGAVIAFAGSTSPAGWLLCDGSAVSRTDYAALFAVIGTTYGAGDGTDTFNLPDLVDKFIQGNATSGTEHSAGLPNITGEVAVGRAFEMYGYGAFESTGNGNVYTTGGGAMTTSTRAKLDASRSSSVYGNSTTVQPPSLTMKYIIKY